MVVAVLITIMQSAKKRLAKRRAKVKKRKRRAEAKEVPTRRVPCKKKAACSAMSCQEEDGGESVINAIRRAQAALLISPRKKLCIVESLAKQVGLNVESSQCLIIMMALSSETEELVVTFYNKNDISKDKIFRREINADESKSKKTEEV